MKSFFYSLITVNGELQTENLFCLQGNAYNGHIRGRPSTLIKKSVPSLVLHAHVILQACLIFFIARHDQGRMPQLSECYR